MTITRCKDQGLTCMFGIWTSITPMVSAFGYCDEPAVVKFETTAGRLDFVCERHAEELLSEFHKALSEEPT